MECDWTLISHLLHLCLGAEYALQFVMDTLGTNETEHETAPCPRISPMKNSSVFILMYRL